MSKKIARVRLTHVNAARKIITALCYPTRVRRFDKAQMAALRTKIFALMPAPCLMKNRMFLTRNVPWSITI